jgi:oligogalacturonide lyase
MAGSGRDFSRRGFLLSGVAVAQLAAQQKKTSFPSEAKRYLDPTTELDVYRLTDPGHSSTLPAYYNRAVAHNSGSMIFCCDRNGAPQAHRMDLKNRGNQGVDGCGGSRWQLPHPDARQPLVLLFCRPPVVHVHHGGPRKAIYQVPDGWERCPGLTVGPDGTHATFAERQGEKSRLQMVPLLQPGPASTVIEVPFVMSHPIPRPMRAQILFRQGDEALWMVNSDGAQKRQLKLAAGKVGPANWATDGKSLLYLNFPADPMQITTIRECVPDTNGDVLVAKTSQYAHFGFNQPVTVFVGACRSIPSPTILIMLRSTRRELTLCEHKASHPEMTAPRFSPDTQRLYFQSDRDGKPAIYGVHLERFLDKTEGETGSKASPTPVDRSRPGGGPRCCESARGYGGLAAIAATPRGAAGIWPHCDRSSGPSVPCVCAPPRRSR